MTSILDTLLQDNQDDKFFQDMTARPKPPLGKYLQWYIKGEKFHISEQKGSVGLQLQVAPLGIQNDQNSAKDRMGANHWLGFARKADEQAGIKGTNNMISWFEVLDATRAEIPGLGQLPARGTWNKGNGKTGRIDGQPANEAQMKAREEERTAFVRKLQRKILEEAKANDNKLTESYFTGYAFYAMAGLDDSGNYVNLVSSVKDASGKRTFYPFSQTLPPGVEFTGA